MSKLKVMKRYIKGGFVAVHDCAKLESISPTTYPQLLRQFPFTKKLQTQTVSTEKLHKTLLSKKAAREMLVKLTLMYFLMFFAEFTNVHRNYLFSDFKMFTKIEKN